MWHNKLMNNNNGQQSSGKLIIIAAILAVGMVLESIALVIAISNYSSLVDENAEEASEVPIEDTYDETKFVYDENYNLLAVDLKCTAENGSTFTFNLDKGYKQHDSTGDSSGTYTITNDSLISLSGSDKILYYDGFDVADGLTIYDCAEPDTESSSAE